MGPGAVVGAAIDVGATSVHLLVAIVGHHRVLPVLDESAFLGLGDQVGAHGALGRETRATMVQVLGGYAGEARRLGASFVTIVGTEPLRRAGDAADAIAEVEDAVGVPVHVLAHEEEGMLTLLGVTEGRRVLHPLLVVDIGGGSAEVVSAEPGSAAHATGLPLGAARLTRAHLPSDPPSPEELDAARTAAREAVTAAPVARPDELVAVGGTASNLLRVLPATTLDGILTRSRIAAALVLLAAQPSEAAAVRFAVRPTRARILPAGAVIVDAILEHYGLDRLRVAEAGIREGALHATARAGDAWRARLPELASGWED